MSKGGSAFHINERSPKPQMRSVARRTAEGRLSDLDGMLKVATGCSLPEGLAWALVVVLWLIFVSFAIAVTLGEYWPVVVFPCRVIGVTSVVMAGVLGGALVLVRSSMMNGKRDARGRSRSADW
jgi:hypothetical protein